MPIMLPCDDPCSFCEYLAGRVRYTIVARDDLVATLVTREQRGALHLLVIPVAHRPTLLDLHLDEQVALMEAVVMASRAIALAVDPDGIAVWQNNGIPAYQTVPHVHFHVTAALPEGGTDWGPVPELDLAETERLAALVRPHLSGA